MNLNLVRILAKIVVFTVYILALHQTGYTAERVPVVVSIAPQLYFVQQIGKDRVDVQVMVPPGAAPHTYEPRPQQMVAITRAKLYFAVGVEFERAWLKKIAAANPEMEIVHTDQGIDKIDMAALRLEHGEPKQRAAGEHTAHHRGHGGLDPHIWLSPPLVKIQVRTIMNSLKNTDPVHRDVYEANHRQFIGALDALDAELRQIFSGKQGLQFMVFHPSWGYFAKAYGLNQIPVQIEGKAPKPAQLKALIEHARQEDIKVIFVQPQYSIKSAVLVAKEIGGQVVFANPLAENWMVNLRMVADQFKAALK